MRLSLIAAMAADGVIGRDNSLPWHLPPDLRRFKQLTMGHVLLMGRRTFESIGQPLPGRKTIVLSRQVGWAPPDVKVAPSLKEALELAERESGGAGEIFVVGGAEIYRQTLKAADRLYLTRIEAEIPGDAWFPSFDTQAWGLVEEERHLPGDEAPFPYRFETWEASGSRSAR